MTTRAQRADSGANMAQKETLLVRRDNADIAEAKLLANLAVHSDAVTRLVAISPFEFASAGNDGLIVFWRVRLSLSEAVTSLISSQGRAAVARTPQFPIFRESTSSSSSALDSL